MPTIFERIIAGELPADIVYQDDLVLAFRDIDPQAPVHLLIVPRQPWALIEQVEPEHGAVLGRLFEVARTVAAQEGLSEGGYRLVLNNGPAAGQQVPHIHVHLLAGRSFQWPPG